MYVQVYCFISIVWFCVLCKLVHVCPELQCIVHLLEELASETQEGVSAEFNEKHGRDRKSTQ